MNGETEEVPRVHPNRVEALSRKLETLREELEDERQERRDLESRVQDVETKLDAIGVQEIEHDTPDKRALAVRKWLYEQAKESRIGKAVMDKKVAAGLLGNFHREQR